MSCDFRCKETGKDEAFNHTCSISSVREKHVLLVLVKTIPDTLNRGKETQTAIEWSSSIFLAQLRRQSTRRQKWIQPCHRSDSCVCTKDSYIWSLHFVGVKWGWKADMYTIPLVPDICTLYICRFLFGLLTILKGTSCCVIRRNQRHEIVLCQILRS